MRPLRTSDDIAQMLETTGRYRVLRRVPAIDETELRPAADEHFLGVAIDCEATGTDPSRAEPIEVVAVKFAYDKDGRLLHLVDLFEGLQQPSQPLDPAVSRLTGLEDVDLAGRRINKDALKAFLSDANLICAHHARYDRVLLETWLGDLPLRPWACSLANIDWIGQGLSSQRLGDILNAHGLYNDGHRARRDIESLVEILRRPLPSEERTGLEALVASARRCSAVVFAEGSAIKTRGLLKARGYRWANGEAGEPRTWWTEIDGGAIRDEVEFLRRHVYDGGPCRATLTLVSALHRFRALTQIAAVRTAAPSFRDA